MVNLFVVTDAEADDIFVLLYIKQFVQFDRMVIMTTLGKPGHKASYIHSICKFDEIKDKVAYTFGTKGIKGEYIPYNLKLDEVNFIDETDVISYLTGSVTVLMIANPVGSESILEQLSDRIDKIHFMGGWYDNMRASFNVNINVNATNWLFENFKSKLLIYSSDMYRKYIGMVNPKTYPTVTDLMIKSDRTKLIVALWNYHITDGFEKFNLFDKEDVMKQFTPADLVTVLPLVYPEFVVETSRYDVQFVTDPITKLIMADIVEDQTGIEVVTKVDVDCFRVCLEDLMKSVPQLDSVTEHNLYTLYVEYEQKVKVLLQ